MLNSSCFLGWIFLLYKFADRTQVHPVVVHTRMASVKMMISMCSGTTKRCCVFSCDTMCRLGAFESFLPRA